MYRGLAQTDGLRSQSTQSAGPVRFLIFCSMSIILLASLLAGRRPQLVQISRECTPPYLPTGISNLIQPAQAEVVLGQLSTYLASWVTIVPSATCSPRGSVKMGRGAERTQAKEMGAHRPNKHSSETRSRRHKCNPANP